ncbi:histidine kinase [Glycomyces sp. TRM65418]|uniref:sensor histidine kinase n=1 Tax=Glycomyces sp. TRM65418 TaxID=2867006 RepID=UPI001CE55087|nr:sensor histidine kinase [Glycomyces sp. TRM65418]MCC3761466.1 histidine kinase [Glycomyces sp. TRM65418]QZD55566.1 two-component sensor histidine kinase [Glycomyces sp. TRM65418]
MNTLRRLPERWRRLDVTVRDLPLGLLFAVLSLMPFLEGHETQVGDLPSNPFGPMTVVVLVLLCLPLAVRRRWPGVCLALVSLGFAVSMLGSHHLVAGTTLAIALISAGAHLERYRRTAAALLTVAYLAVALALVDLGSTESPGDFAVFYLLAAAAWGTGAWLRSTRAAEAERRRHVAAATRAAERASIARELHDVVTHHVTAMVVQAEAARYLTGAPDRLDQALKAVGETGRRATTDLRHLLDLLEPDHGGESRTPPVGRLLTLVEQTRRAGQPMEFAEEGTPPVSTGSADLVAYRIVQEALTNALKHAHGTPTAVRVRHRESEITVEVSTEGPGSASAVAAGSGRGLAGLRERVDLLGGDFEAGPRTDGGFVVRARIPAGTPS